MAKFSFGKKSISYFYGLLTVIIILAQVFLLAFMFVFGGVFKQAQSSAYKSFNDTVNNRRDYMQLEMKNRWTNLAPFLPELRKNISINKDSSLDASIAISDNLIKILRTTGVTGAYFIYGNSEVADNVYPALYFRDYDPLSNSSKNDDIYMMYGPSELAQHYKMPLDSTWKYNFHLTEENKDFFLKPYSESYNGAALDYLDYWSRPFKLTEEDTEIITYSLPLQDVNGKIVGIVGIELALNYLVKFLPSSELQPKDSLGYIVARKDPTDTSLRTMITTNNIQKRFLDNEQALLFNLVDDQHQMYKLENSKIKENIHASMSKLNLYPYNSPFQDEEWYIIGFVKTSHLLSYVERIAKILMFSLVISLITGIIGGLYVSRKMSKPVVSLSEQVIKADKTKPLSLKPTGLLELDELSDAIVQTNKLMLDSSSRLSRIIEMVDLPLGAFELNKKSDQVLLTGRVYELIGMPTEDNNIYKSKYVFNELFQAVLENPEVDEDNVYKVPTIPNCWVKIKMTETEEQMYGIIQDVSEEILEKKQIKHDRDIDSLTKLLNRKSFEHQYKLWSEEKRIGVSALIMFDLDFLKQVNDTYGHKWGDYYIIEAAKQLKDFVKSDQSIIGRRSGDEFVVLLHSFNSKDEIRSKIEDFFANLKNYTLKFPNDEQREIKISAGFVWIDDHAKPFDDLLHLADVALYFSKENNKGYFTEYGN